MFVDPRFIVQFVKNKWSYISVPP